MDLKINSAVCQGHGRCYGLAPDVIECDDQGFPAKPDVLLPVPPGEESIAQEVVGSCPEGAISLL